MFLFFNDELDLLIARLHELDGVVDRFVIVQAEFIHGTCRYQPPQFEQHADLFAQWSHKITSLIAPISICSMGLGRPSEFGLESAQRDEIGGLLHRAFWTDQFAVQHYLRYWAGESLVELPDAPRVEDIVLYLLSQFYFSGHCCLTMQRITV